MAKHDFQHIDITETEVKSFVSLLLGDFEPNFGERVGRMVYDNDLYIIALGLATEREKLLLPAADQAKVAFRAAYALEYAFFINQEHFISKCIHAFIESFSLTKNRSAHRHFGKIMTTLLQTKRLILNPEQAMSVAEAAASWLADPKSKVAVQIWTLKILSLLAPQVEWVTEILPDVIALLSLHPTPAMEVTLRQKFL